MNTWDPRKKLIFFLPPEKNWNIYFLRRFLQLDLAVKDKKGGDISSFITNGEWDLIGMTMSNWFIHIYLALFIRDCLSYFLSFAKCN